MKKVLCALLAAVVAASVLCLSAAAAPKPLYEETFDNMTQGVDGETFFLDSDIISNGRHIDQNTYIDGKVAISSDKDKVVDGTKSLYFHNYVSEEDEGPYYAQWGNFFSTKPILKDSSTYIMSFLLRTHTAWDPAGNTITPTHTQNFGIVSVRSEGYKDAQGSLADYYIQPHIQAEEFEIGTVNPDFVRIEDMSVPANAKNTMEIKRLSGDTYSIVVKFVTGKTEVAEKADTWHLNWTFHGEMNISIDNVRIWKSDLKPAMFHQELPEGSETPNEGTTSTPDSTTSTPAGTTSTPDEGTTSTPDETPSTPDEGTTSTEDVTSTPAGDTTSTEDATSTPTDGTNSQAGGQVVQQVNWPATIGLIAGIVVVVAAAAVLVYIFVIKKKKA